MTKKLGWAALGLLLLTIFALSWAPYGIKRYAESHYPVRVGGVNLHWGRVTFTQVILLRDDVSGTLDQVDVGRDKTIRITGGTLIVDLNRQKPESSTATSSRHIEGVGLRVGVHKGEAEATLEKVRFDEQEVCFETGSLSYKTYHAQVTEGCVSRSDKMVRAKRIEVPFELPFTVPHVEKQQTLKIEGVQVNPVTSVLSWTQASLLPFIEVKGAGSAHLAADQTLLLATDNLVVNHPWISPEAVTFARVSLMAPKSLLKGEGELSMTDGPVQVLFEPSKFHLSGRDTCNNWVEALPTPLPLALQQAAGHFSGNLAFEVSRDPSPHFDVKESCRFECTAEPIKSLKSGRVQYMAYDKDDKLFERTIGPGTKDWVSIASLPPHVPKAFITLEDPGFPSHRGIIPQALENSFKDNLKLGRFFRGGSTITMQLAKNLWLRRSKTIGRKAQEALLTTALESCLSKSEILELYMNAVEMGPNLYGIGAASHAYFHKDAADLEPEEAFYLASILPHPRKALAPDRGGLASVRALMRNLGANGLLNDALVPVRDDEVNAAGWDAD